MGNPRQPKMMGSGPALALALELAAAAVSLSVGEGWTRERLSTRAFQTYCQFPTRTIVSTTVHRTDLASATSKGAGQVWCSSPCMDSTTTQLAQGPIRPKARQLLLVFLLFHGLRQVGRHSSGRPLEQGNSSCPRTNGLASRKARTRILQVLLHPGAWLGDSVHW